MRYGHVPHGVFCDIRQAVLFDQGAYDVFDEERVALRLLVDESGQRQGMASACCTFDEVGNILYTEALQREALVDLRTRQFPQGLIQRVSSSEPDVTAGAEHQDTGISKLMRQELEQQE